MPIEDAAQAIDSYYKGKPLGGLGNMAAFSGLHTENNTHNHMVMRHGIMPFKKPVVILSFIR